MPPPPSEFDRELKVLEAELKRLEAEYNQFFAGRLPRLPWEQRSRVDAMMKRIDRMHIQNTGDRFRFQTVQSRWAAFSELWERQMKAQETGRRPGRGRGAGAAPPSMAAAPPREASAPRPGAPAEPAEPARDGVVASATISNLSDQKDRVRVLYDEEEGGEASGDWRRTGEGRPAPAVKSGSDASDVARLGALGAVDDLEFDRLPFFERPEAGALDCRVMHEDVATAFALDESITLGVVEPLDLACNAHRSSS
jgi:hypothetical protein